MSPYIITCMHFLRINCLTPGNQLVVLFLGRTSLSFTQLPVVLCVGLKTPCFPRPFWRSLLSPVVQPTFGQLYWWNLMGVASGATRRHNPTVTVWYCCFCTLSASSFAMISEPYVRELFYRCLWFFCQSPSVTKTNFPDEGWRLTCEYKDKCL